MKAILSVVFPVNMTKDFQHFLAILLCITPLDSALNISKVWVRIGHKVPYRCAKSERNRSTGGCFGWLKVTFVKQCKEEEKDEENRAIFRNTYLVK